MENRFEISIIIPLYNAGKLIVEAFESLLRQTIGFERIQVIIVNDCSTDESVAIVKEYELKYENVQVLNTESNSGAAGKPRNIGLDHVDAPYVMFLDTDDLYVDEACRILYEKIRESHADIVGGSYWRVDKDGTNPVVGDQNLPQHEIVYELPNDIEDAVKYRGPLWTKIFSMQFLKENGIRFLNSGYGQDTAFVCECIAHADKYVFIPDPLCLYRYNDSSVTRIINEEFFARNLNSVKRCSEVLQPYESVQKWLLGHLYGYYYWTLILARNIDVKEVTRILTNYPELFGKVDAAVPSIRILGLLLSEKQQEIAAEYIAQLRLSYDMQAETERLKREMMQSGEAYTRQIASLREEYMNRVCDMQAEIERYKEEMLKSKEIHTRQITSLREKYENRIAIRLADAFKNKNGFEVITLGYEFLKKCIKKK